MTEPCTCTTNPNPHQHRYLRPMTAAAVIGRPFQTVDSWRKRGDIPSTGHGYGQSRVCVCCAAAVAEKAPVRWVKRARRRTGRPVRGVAA